MRTIGNVVQIGRDNKDSQDQRNAPRAFEKTGQNEATAGFVTPLQEYRNALAETFAPMSMAMRFNEEETQQNLLRRRQRMTNDVAREFQKLETVTAGMLGELSTWDTKQLTLRPVAGCWSALDIIAHLCEVEMAFTASLRQGMAGPAKVAALERLRARVVITVMKTPLRVKVPTAGPVTASPQGKGTLEEAQREWKVIRHRLQKCLAGLDSASVERGLLRHPVSGWMTGGLAVAFLAAHCRHHLYQVQRLKRMRVSGNPVAREA